MRYYALAERPWVEEDGGGQWGLPPGTIGSVDLAPVGSHSHVFVTSDKPFAPADVVAQIGDGTRLDRYVPNKAERDAWEKLVGVVVQPGWTLLDALWATLTSEADPDGLIRAKPIMPTHRGVLELHLGGHSLLRAEKLPTDPTTHPAWPNIQRVLQNDYRAIQTRDRTLAAKWLGAQRLKYRLAPETARDLLIPADLPRVLPLKPTTTIGDTFNRSDSSDMNASHSGKTLDGTPATWSWRTVRGIWEIKDSRAYNNGSSWNVERADGDLSSDDHKVSAELEWPSVEASHRIFAVAGRMNDAGGDMEAQVGYIADADKQNNSVRISRWGNSAVFDQTVIQSWSRTINLDTVYSIEIEIDGSNITLRFDGGAFEETVSDSNITGNVRTGIWSVHGDGFLDNFEASDLLAGEGDDLVRVLTEAMGTGDTRVRALGLARARGDVLALAEASARVRDLARLRPETVDLAEAGLFVRALARLRAGQVAIAETTVSVLDAIGDAIIRIVTEATGVAETVARPRRITRTRTDLIGIGGAVVRIGGVVSATVPAVVGTARRMIVKAASRFNVPPARR